MLIMIFKTLKHLLLAHVTCTR